LQNKNPKTLSLRSLPANNEDSKGQAGAAAKFCF